MPGRVPDDPESTTEEVRKRCGLPENACCGNCAEREDCMGLGWDDDCDDDPRDDVRGSWVLSPPYEGKLYEVIDNKVVTTYGVEFEDD